MTGTDRLGASTARMVGRLREHEASAHHGGVPLTLRSVRDTDGPALTHLIAAAYDEFDCGPADPTGFDADLALPASYARERERSWWAVTDAHDVVVGSAAHSALRTIDGSPQHSEEMQAEDMHAEGIVELQRLYLAPDVRGSGLASVLIRGIAAEAALLGAGRLVAWSDSRLTAAHERYLAIGFALTEAKRRLDDPAGSVEIRFELDLPLR